MTIRIAMWSGPRNISTAMMRSWENRTDCSVVDEPFYAYYLNETNSPHPMFDKVLDSQSKTYSNVATTLNSGQCDTPIQYQKHMTHHMLVDDFDWASSLKHCFLIREPAQVINSYTNSRGTCSAEDIGINRQWEIYQKLTALTGQNIPVIESNDVLKNPEYMLSKLCQRLEVPFQQNMLQWPKGKRNSDGIWADHWYHSVINSTGFSPWQRREISLTSEQDAVLMQVTDAYEALKKHKLPSLG